MFLHPVHQWLRRGCHLHPLLRKESMESSYADEENGGLLQENLIPNLTNLASGNVNFSSTEKLGGGIDLAGTGCKMSA